MFFKFFTFIESFPEKITVIQQWKHSYKILHSDLKALFESGININAVVGYTQSLKISKKMCVIELTIYKYITYKLHEFKTKTLCINNIYISVYVSIYIFHKNINFLHRIFSKSHRHSNNLEVIYFQAD